MARRALSGQQPARWAHRAGRSRPRAAGADRAVTLLAPTPEGTAARAPATLLAERWFGQRGWQPFAFQREVWVRLGAGGSGLLHASTGSGKTYAVWFGALARGAALDVPFDGPHAPPLGVL